MKTSMFWLSAAMVLLSASESLAQCCCVPPAIQPTRIVSVQSYGCQPTQVVFAERPVYHRSFSTVNYGTEPAVLPFAGEVGNTVMAHQSIFQPAYDQGLPVIQAVQGSTVTAYPTTTVNPIRTVTTRNTMDNGLIKTAGYRSFSPTPSPTYTCRAGVNCSTGTCKVLEASSIISQADAQAKLQQKISQYIAACSGTVTYKDVLVTVDLSGVTTYECGPNQGSAGGTCSVSF